MFRVSGLSVSIGPIPIIRSASFALEEGKMYGLIGRNGAGKTTLFRAIMGAVPASGTVELGSTAEGRPIEPSVAVKVRPAELGVVAEGRPVEPAAFD